MNHTNILITTMNRSLCRTRLSDYTTCKRNEVYKPIMTVLQSYGSYSFKSVINIYPTIFLLISFTDLSALSVAMVVI